MTMPAWHQAGTLPSPFIQWLKAACRWLSVCQAKLTVSCTAQQDVENQHQAISELSSKAKLLSVCHGGHVAHPVDLAPKGKGHVERRNKRLNGASAGGWQQRRGIQLIALNGQQPDEGGKHCRGQDARGGREAGTVELEGGVGWDRGGARLDGMNRLGPAWPEALRPEALRAWGTGLVPPQPQVECCPPADIMQPVATRDSQPMSCKFCKSSGGTQAILEWLCVLQHGQAMPEAARPSHTGGMGQGARAGAGAVSRWAPGSVPEAA